jgi:hypothetical protein
VGRVDTFSEEATDVAVGLRTTHLGILDLELYATEISAMSLRAHISSFEFQKLQALFGSRDEATVEAAARVLRKQFGLDEPDEEWDEEAATEVEHALAICRRAVFEGVPFPDLEMEDDEHAIAAVALAVVGQKHRGTSFGGWKVTHVFHPLLRDHSTALSIRGRELLSYLSDGRPIFGRKNGSSWSYYAYLTSNEVQELHAALLDLQRAHPELKGETYLDGFVDALAQALADVSSNRKARDLWLEAG